MLDNILDIETCANSSREWLVYVYPFSVTLSVISVVINLLHILILVNMAELRERRHFWILLNITLVDIISDVMYLIVKIWNLYNLQTSTNNARGIALTVIGLRSATICRYYQLTLASLDRYYAICKPFDYGNSRLINNIGKLSILSWIFNIAFYTFKVTFTAEDSCLGALNTIMVSEMSEKRYLNIFGTLTMLLPSVVTAVLLTKVGRELKRMSKRGNATDDREVREATRYIIGTCIMFFSSVVPLVGLVILRMAIGDPENSYVKVLQIFVIIFQSFYGIGNVVLYGYLYPSYRQKIKKVFRLSNCNPKISPI